MTGEPRRALGVDLGLARIGLAVSDPSGVAARPLRTIERIGPRRDPARIAELAREFDAGLVVVGLPLEMSGEAGQPAEAARAFVARLRGRLPGVRVELWDERLTTVQAERAMLEADVSRAARRERIDAVAAALILQSYLDRLQAGGLSA